VSEREEYYLYKFDDSNIISIVKKFKKYIEYDEKYINYIKIVKHINDVYAPKNSEFTFQENFVLKPLGSNYEDAKIRFPQYFI